MKLLAGCVLVSTFAAAHALAAAPDPAPEEKAPAPEAPPTPAIPPKKAAPAPAAEAEAPPPVETGAISWDALAGGVPQDGALITVELGFSGLPRATYQQSLGGGLSIGGSAAFDFADSRPDYAFLPALVLGAPIRYSLPLTDSLVLGLRGDPGIGFRFPKGGASFHFGILLNMEANLGFTLQRQFLIGGGIAMPVSLYIGNATTFAWPILAGPIFEYHVVPGMALTADLKIGGHLASTGSGFGMRLLGGVAIRL